MTTYRKFVEGYSDEHLSPAVSDILKQYYDDIEYDYQTYQEHLLKMYGTPEEIKFYFDFKEKEQKKLQAKIREYEKRERKFKDKYEHNKLKDY